MKLWKLDQILRESNSFRGRGEAVLNFTKVGCIPKSFINIYAQPNSLSVCNLIMLIFILPGQSI